jgi:hypothetical protein
VYHLQRRNKHHLQSPMRYSSRKRCERIHCSYENNIYNQNAFLLIEAILDAERSLINFIKTVK